MQIMGYRLNEMRASLAALERGGEPYVGYANGEFYPVGQSDDLGSYFFIPQIAKWFDLPVDTAVYAFYLGALALASIVGVFGLIAYFRSWTSRAVAVGFYSILMAGVVGYADVYLAGPCCIIACVPWAFWLAERANRARTLLGGAVLIGLTIGLSNVVRGHSGTGVLLLSLILVGFAARHTIARRLAFAAMLLAAATVAPQYHSRVLHEAEAFLRAKSPQYAGRTSADHPMWHSIYIGLGYVSNPHGIAYNDNVALQAARAVDPTVVYMSTDYERILRGRVWTLLQEDPWFICKAALAKAGRVASFLFRFAHLGLPALCCGPLARRQSLALLTCAAFTALPGVLVIPSPEYLLGFRAATSFIAILGLGLYAENNWAPLLNAGWFASRWHSFTFASRRWVSPTLQFVTFVAMSYLVIVQTGKTYGIAKCAVAASFLTAKAVSLKNLVSSGNLTISRNVDLHALRWVTIAAGADLRREDEQLLLRTAGDRYDLQMESKVAVYEDVVYVTYELEVLRGGVALGIVNGRGDMADAARCDLPGVYRGAMAASLDHTGDLRLIVQNANAAAPDGDSHSTCVIKQLNVALGSEDVTTTVLTAGSGGKLKLPR